MKIHSNEFKNELAKLGREIDLKIFLHTNDKIITQDGKFLMTEDNLHLVVEQFNESEIDETITGEDIYNVSIINKGNILSTMMKELDFEIKQDLRIGDLVDCSFGVKVDDEYEYINYGRYIVYSKEFNEHTKTYYYIAYDSMLLTMQEIPDTSEFENITLYNAMKKACEDVGLTAPTDVSLRTQNLYWSSFDKVINEGAFTDLDMTYRDLLDMICQAMGLSMIVSNKTLQVKSLKNTNVGGPTFIIADTINENYLKDINVSFGKKYGPINSVVLSRSEDNDNIYRKDDESIEEYGLCEFKIKDNPILLYDDREDYIQEIFNALKGTEFYVNDFKSIGITYLDWLDFYNVQVGDKTYQCLMLNDEIKISQGLEENIYTDEPEETTTDYKTSSKTDKEVSFIVDKQRGEISSKVSKGSVISSINQSAEEIKIQADKISLEGTVTANNNFKIKTDGTMECKGATINEGKINLQGGTKITPKFSIVDSDNHKCYILPYELNITGESAYFRTQVNLLNYGDTDLEMQNIHESVDTGKPAYFRVHLDGTDETDFIELIRNEALFPSKSFRVRLEQNKIEQYLYKPSSEINQSLYEDGGVEYALIKVKTSNASTYIYSTGIVTPTLTQTSKEEDKKNFEKLKNSLDIIKKIDIYKYHLKSQNNEEKKHIGFVIGDKYKYSQEITSNNNDGVDIYSFVSVCCKAIQEQQEIIENLQSRIEKLEKESDK